MFRPVDTVKAAAPQVTLYSLPGCVLCRRVRAFLAAHERRFSEVNVLTRPRVLQGRLFAYRKSLPLVAIGDRFLVGGDRRELVKFLARLRGQARLPARRRGASAISKKP